MIPPLPTINDAIGLLAALSDPDKAKALLEEAKTHVETANKVFADARAAQAEADLGRQKYNVSEVNITAAKKALSEEKVRYELERQAAERAIATTLKVLDARSAALDKQETEQNARAAVLDSRGRSFDMAADRLSQQERDLAGREAKVNGMMKMLQPIMEKLR